MPVFLELAIIQFPIAVIRHCEAWHNIRQNGWTNARISANAKEQDMTLQTIDIDQGKQLIDQNNVIIVDIRDPAAYGSGHIENARHIHDGNVEEFIETADKTRPLLIYCYHGFTSLGAAEYFVHSGFTEVYSLDGGFESWRSRYPVVHLD